MENRTGKRWPIVVGVVVLLLCVAGFIGAKMLDGYLLKRARAEADAFGKEIGRPVLVEDVTTRFFSGFGASIDGLEVGAGPGEDMPLAHVGRVEVKAPLIRALRSGGKDVVIRSVEMKGLVLNVIRLADGTTNVERLQKALDERSAKAPAQPASDLSYLRIDHAELVEAQVKLLDKTGGQTRELAITHLNAVLDDLRAGNAVELKLNAAVFAPEKNLELSLKTTPLDNSLTAIPQRLTLKVAPLDLAPLASFLPKDLGFQAGRFDADLQAELGGAVAGGEGPTKVVGSAHGQGLKFAGAEGGKPLDTKLDIDVTGDATKGDLDIRRLTFDFGPAGIKGQGKVSGLLSAAPSVQGLEVTGHDLDPAVLATYYPPLRKQLKGQVAGPIGLSARAAGTQAAQSIQLELDFTPVMIAIPQQLTKKAGAPMKLSANLQGAGSGALRFSSTVDLTGADLRPGGSLNKGPGDPMSVVAEGSYRPGESKAGTSRLDLTQLTARVLGDTVTGKGNVQMSKTRAGQATEFDLAMSSPHLDLDRLLIEADKSKPAPSKKAEDYAGLRGHAAIKVGTLVAQKMEMQNVLLDINMAGELITMNTLTLNLYGGQVNASGTSMHLAGEAPPFELKAKVSGVDAGALLAKRAPKRVLNGKLNCELDLKGNGSEKVDLAQTLAGVVTGSLTDGTFLGTDLLAAVTGPLARALPFAGKQISSLNGTSLGKDLPFGVQIEKGVAQLKRPISITRPEANLSFDGGIHLDGKLNLTSTMALQPATLSRLTAGRVNPKAPIPVSFKLVGPAWSPTVTDLDLKPAVQMLAGGAVAGLAGKVLGEKGGKVVGDVLQGDGKKVATEAVDAQKKAAEQRAREEADRVKTQGVEEGAKRLKGIFGK